MSRLEELIQELCPDGVEYKKISDVSAVERGVRVIRKNLSTDEGYPVYQNSLAPLGYHTQFNRSGRTVFIISAGAAGDVGFSDVDFWAADDCLYICETEELDQRYLYHVFLSKQNIIYGNVRKASIPRLARSVIEGLEVPVPPLEVQREIVRVLDHFTLLRQELSAELSARRKQYEYYRDELLTFGDDVPMVPLQYVVKKSLSGATPNKSNKAYYENGTIPWIRTQDVKFNDITAVDSYITENAVKETAAKWIPKNCVIVAISGASAGRCAINKIEATTNQHCLNMIIDEGKALYQYVYYCVAAQYEELLSRKQGARGDLNSSLILGVSIPLPSLEKQKDIIDAITAFNVLLNDISSGLPAEIEARQKQYEYYRDQMLSFKRKEAS